MTEEEANVARERERDERNVSAAAWILHLFSLSSSATKRREQGGRMEGSSSKSISTVVLHLL